MADTLSTLLKNLSQTNVTAPFHKRPYASILPSRPELNQAGRVVMVTGGGTGVGFSVCQSFVKASAATIIIIGRRADVLATAASRLELLAEECGTKTKIMSRTCDISNTSDVESLWKDIAGQGIHVDVWVASAAKFSDPKPILELGPDEVWSQFEANVKSPLYFSEKFLTQPKKSQKFLINVSTGSIHMTAHPVGFSRPAYNLTKLSGTMLFQLLAQHTSPDEAQIVSFHPGVVYNDRWKAMGLSNELFDDDDLCGAFAVWLATEEAEFLHGRFVWSSWDVDQLASSELRKRIDEDPYFLRATISGLNDANLA